MMDDKVKKRLFKILKAAKITHVVLKYEGSGDSGNVWVETITQKDKDFEYSWDSGSQKSKLKHKGEEFDSRKVRAPQRSQVFDKKKEKWVVKETMVWMTLESYLEDFGYLFLERYGGWEINEGSDGEITIDVGEGSISNEHSYYTRECHTESVQL